MKKKGKVYRRLYVSYLVIFVIPIVLSAVFYSYVYNQIQKKTTDYNQSILEIVKSECDREISSFENMLARLAFDSQVQLLSSVKGGFGLEDSYNIYNVRTELHNAMTFNSVFSTYFNDIFVYFGNSDKVISAVGGAMDFGTYYELYCKSPTFTQEEMAQYMSGFHYRNTKLVEAGKPDENPYLLMTMTNLKGDLGESTALVGIKVDINALNYIINLIKGEDGTKVLILDSDNQVINNKTGEYDLDYASLQDGKTGEIRLDKELYIIQSTNSTVNDWKFVSLTPQKKIGELAIHIRNVFFLGTLVCLVLGFGVSRRMTSNVYVFWENLMDLFRSHREKPEEAEQDEYAYLQNQVVRLVEEHADFRQIVSSDRKIVRQYYLTRLLEAPYDELEIMEERDLTSENLKDGFNRVLLLHTEEKGEDDQNTEEFIKKISLWKFIIGNVFTEGLSECFKTETVEVGNAVAAIVNSPEHSKENQEKLNEIIYNLQKFIQDNFDFQVIVLIGRAHEGLLGINQSYKEARETEDYVKILEEDCIFYEEIGNSGQGNYYYPIEMENKVISAMQANNAQLAISYVNHILDVNYLENKLSPIMLKCLIFDIMGTIMKCGDKLSVGGGPNGNIEEINTKDISIKMSLDELKDKFAELIKAMCPEIEAPKVEAKAANKLVDRVIAYINENFHNQDLNISQTGIHFNVTPSYLSAIFKKQTGMSLLKYINQVRIEEAEKLLKSGVSVVETAERVGFRDSSTFIRVFKKMTGATPGQMKA